MKLMLTFNSEGCFKCPIQGILIWQSDSGLVSRLDCQLIGGTSRNPGYIYTERHPKCPLIEIKEDKEGEE